MIVRVLAASSPSALRARIAGMLDDEAASRVIAAEHAVFVDDHPAAGILEGLRSAGAVVELAANGALVVAASRAQLDRARVERFITAHANVSAERATLRVRDRTLDLADEARVMGIVNVTPDSFYDRASGIADVLARTRAIIEGGGSLVDIGGQSYASWNPRIAADEEIGRVVPAVAAIRSAALDIAISIDTFKAPVAQAALAAGAHVINDCSGLSEPALAGVVAEHDAAIVIMHLKGELNVRDPAGYHYDDAMKEIVEFLFERTERALAAGIARDAIVIDPGLEFGKEPVTDLEILDRFGELRALGYPILFASSRKSFIGRIFGRPAKELLIPSLATAAIGITAGARLVRVHDIEETVQLCRMMAAVTPGRRTSLALAPKMPGTPGNPSGRGAV